MEGTAAIYVRVSSLAQVEGHSLQAQVDDCRRDALGKDLAVPDDLVFVEEGVSGTHATRPQFDRMLDAARAGRYQTLVVWKISRYARNTLAALQSLSELQELGVRVVFVKDNIDTSSQMARLVLLPLLAGFAEMESESIAAQSMLGKWKGAQLGAWVSGVGPFGFRTVGEAHARTLEADTEPWDGAGGKSAAEVVQLAFRLCAEDGLGPFQVSQRLNALEIPPPAAWPRTQRRPTHRTGWEHGTVKKLLTDEAYVGRAAFGRPTRVKPSPEIVEARRRKGHRRPEEKVKVLAPPDRVIRIDVPCLVDEAVFAAAQRRLATTERRGQSQAKRLYLLTNGRMVCGDCGRPYYGSTVKGKYSYLRCTGTLPRIPLSERCSGPKLDADSTEDRVWRHVLAMLDDEDGQLYSLVSQRQPASPAADQDTAEARAVAEKRLAELEVEMRRLTTAIRRGTVPDDMGADEMRDMDAERGTVRQQLRRLQATSSGTDAWAQFQQFLRAAVGTREALRDATVEQKDQWLQDLAVKVTVLPDGALDIFMVLPMSESEVEAQAESEWQERMTETYGEVSTKVPPTGFEPVLPP